MDKPCSYCICDCDKSCVCEIQEKAYLQGREDAFHEIAYSDSVIKEPFETLAYEKGKADGVKEFVEWLLHQDKVMYDSVSKDFYTCDDEHYIISTLSVDEVLVEWKKGIENYELSIFDK